MKPQFAIMGILLSAMVVRPLSAEEAVEVKTESRAHGPLIEAIVNGKPIADLRYRFEWKEQDGFLEDAYANTLRTRLGYETAEFYDFRILLEFENVVALGADRFNNTTNGRLAFPVIADPDATEVNRAQVTFTGIPKTAVTIGRQRVNIANQRFVGAVDFRQNQQTFDAARVTAGSFGGVSAEYLYIDRVHRIFGDDHPFGEFNSDSHVVTVTADGGEFGKLTGYGLLLDLDEGPALSSATWGARYENGFEWGSDAAVGLGIVAEFATQSDYADNPFDYREYYVHGETTLSAHGFGLKAGYEQLGGNGVIGFSTPLATLHKFQGFADVFLTTPPAGIRDLYGGASYFWKPAPFGTAVQFFAIYHDFADESGALDFGREIDAGITIGIGAHWSVLIKGAVYEGGDSGPADRNLVWTSLQFRY